MKKLILFVCLMCSVMAVYGAEAKKVAILEVEDTENALERGQKLMLRSSLAKAVANTAGYEAFDRTSLDAIMEEHNFQRTGFVNQKEIKELGKMTGVAYILVSEAAKTGDRKIVVAVKLVNVETAKVEMSDNAVMGISSDDMQRGCDMLASALLDKKKHGKRITTEEQPKRQKEQLTRVGFKYVYDGANMSAKGCEQFLLSRCTPAYKQFHSGKIMQYSGYGAFGAGALMIGIGAALLPKDKTHTAGAALVSIGTISAAAGVTLWTFGYLNKRKSINTFNAQYASLYPLEFKLQATPNGIGLAMSF